MSAHADSEVMFSGEPEYLDGYVPTSWDSQHSSLQRSLTWLGMALILVATAAAGLFVFGFASDSVGSQENGLMLGTVGGVLTVVILLTGFAFVHFGRSAYRDYKKRTGRVH
ncbi:MAG TPA: hypothetical protein H9870_03685 [Candidatus Corynebacterium avicola]|uniref:Uncharacterized protein n=1 Tax=Candidatus Corynebacterium avicola TaxID=2838527 RepID=A0A9D1ULF3_9CORY|nr:hypothetical protein [Candidatus Corynebacterium avicola]